MGGRIAKHCERRCAVPTSSVPATPYPCAPSRSVRFLDVVPISGESGTGFLPLKSTPESARIGALNL